VTGDRLRIGTRGSALALAQAGTIADALGGELVVITSEGDTSTASLASLGGTGVFAKALRDALLAGAFDTLPPGARIGTGSPRRRAQVASLRPDLELVDIRGNVDTRLGRVGDDDPERALDAVILAAAGLERVGRSEAVTELLDIGTWPTAPAQGALAIETRRDEEGLVSRLDHRTTRLTTSAERGVLAELEAGCAAPIGAHAFVEDGMLFLTARVYAPDGSAHLTASHATVLQKDAAADVAGRVAAELLTAGAAELAPLG
jgi:hydroxymethylbilane synthase